MTDETANPPNFLANLSTALQETEQKFRTLAHQALLTYEQALRESENGQHDQSRQPPRRWQHLSQHLSKLSEQSRMLYEYLNNDFESPSVGAESWSRVRILQSQEEERAQLAHELEDHVGQLLANAVFELASCRTLLDHNKEAVATGLEALQIELESGLATIRQFIVDLEPATILGSFGLGAGIRRYLEQFETRTGLKTQLFVNTNVGRLPSIFEITIFRVIQEALINAHRHAKASQINVIIEEKEGQLHFSITDNGAGLNIEQVGKARKNLGLARMVDYAELLSGKLRILSDLNGTQVILSIPYPDL
ncbi:MAG: sensor histidine kinase [Anaerolineae bacterium]